MYLALSWSATCVTTSIESRLITAAKGTNPEKKYISDFKEMSLDFFIKD